jgi:hypothetical protein
LRAILWWGTGLRERGLGVSGLRGTGMEGNGIERGQGLRGTWLERGQDETGLERDRVVENGLGADRVGGLVEISCY